MDGLGARSQGRSKDLPVSMTNGLGTNPIDDTFSKTSPTFAAVQEADVARRILKQRSTRGRPRQLPPDRLTERRTYTKRNTYTKEIARDHSRRQLSRPKCKRGQSKTIKTIRAIDLSYDSAIDALRAYHDDHSHLVMPRKYVVEEVEKYPKEWHGVDLAATVYDMKWWLRHVQQRPDRVADLNKLGFVWERLQPEFNLILEALITYRSLHDNLLVPSKFVVPFGDEQWSRACWGISLGKAVYRIRSRGDFLRGNKTEKRRRQLNALGFVWDVQEYKFETFCDALRLYAKHEASGDSSRRTGALKVPTQFIVPDSKDWPQSLWGYPLGAKCTAIRQKGLYVKGDPERMRVLAEIGFHVGGNDSLSWLEVVHAAAVYSQMHNRNLDVPQKFVVPAPPCRGAADSYKTSRNDGVVGSDDAWPWPGRFLFLHGSL